MKKILVIILVSSVFLTLNCLDEDTITVVNEYKPINGSFIIQLRQNAKDMNRFKYTISQHITNRYVREDSYCNISWQKKDSYNKNKANYSIFPILDFGLNYLVYKDSDHWEFNPKNLYSPYFLLNSSHYFLINKMKYKFPSINLALFVKNNTDIFVFEKNNWAQLSPGFGVRLFLGGIIGLTIEAGFENRSVYLFNEKKIINNSCYFFSFGLLSGPV